MISSDACCWMRPHWNTSMFTVCPALGGLPRKFQPDRTSWGVWESYTHPVFLLQRNSGHIPLHWAEWTHSHRPGSVPCAGMGHYFPLHCAGGQVHRKGKKSSPLCGTLCAGLNDNTSSAGIKPPTSWLLFWSFGGIFISSQSQGFAPLWPPSSYSFMLQLSAARHLHWCFSQIFSETVNTLTKGQTFGYGSMIVSAGREQDWSNLKGG